MKSRYFKQIKRKITEFDPSRANKYFLFGSFVRGEKYHDIDLGVIGNEKSRKNLSELEDVFYDSTIPYKVDIVDFDGAEKDFKHHVFKKEPLLWIR